MVRRLQPRAAATTDKQAIDARRARGAPTAPATHCTSAPYTSATSGPHSDLSLLCGIPSAAQAPSAAAPPLRSMSNQHTSPPREPREVHQVIHVNVRGRTSITEPRSWQYQALGAEGPCGQEDAAVGVLDDRGRGEVAHDYCSDGGLDELRGRVHTATGAPSVLPPPVVLCADASGVRLPVLHLAAPRARNARTPTC